MPHLLFFLFLLSLSPPVFSSYLTVATPSNTLDVFFAYSTLGTREKQTINFTSVKFLHASNFKNCAIVDENSASLEGHLVIFADDAYYNQHILSDFARCVTANTAHPLIFGSLLQDAGAAGLIIFPDTYETTFHDGRVTGFSDKIKIPVLVVSKHDMARLQTLNSSIEYITLPPITSYDNGVIDHLYAVVHAFTITNTILYVILIILLGYLLIVDVISITQRAKKGWSSYVIGLKIAALVATISEFLWVTIDPCSYRQRIMFQSLAVYWIALGSLIVVYAMILKLWASASGAETTNPTVYKVSKYIVYAIIFVQTAMTIITASATTNDDILFAFVYCCIACVAICDVGYCYYGIRFIAVMCGSGNANPKQQRMPFRIAAFIACYVILSTINAVVFCTHALGVIINMFFFQFCAAFITLFTFLVLFFRRLDSTTNTNLEQQ